MTALNRLAEKDQINAIFSTRMKPTFLRQITANAPIASL
jgi:hypothetical protein